MSNEKIDRNSKLKVDLYNIGKVEELKNEDNKNNILNFFFRLLLASVTIKNYDKAHQIN